MKKSLVSLIHLNFQLYKLYFITNSRYWAHSQTNRWLRLRVRSCLGFISRRRTRGMYIANHKNEHFHHQRRHQQSQLTRGILCCYRMLGRMARGH